MTSRREFLRRSAIITTGVVVAGKLELIERSDSAMAPSPAAVRDDGVWFDGQHLKFLVGGRVYTVPSV